MIKVLLDINVILDVLEERMPGYTASVQVLSLCETKAVQGYLAANSFGILHYIISRGKKSTRAIPVLKKLRAILKVCLLDDRIVDEALDSDFPDFEDALQDQSAVASGLTHLVTRNKKDFTKSKLIILTPEELIGIIESF